MVKFQKQKLEDSKGNPFAIVISVEEYEKLLETIEDKDDIISVLQFEISKLKGEAFNPTDLKWENAHKSKNERQTI
jgi:FtsZ-binding cell division protein ZapB